MSYHPAVYTPNSEKTVFRMVEGGVNSTLSAGDRVEIESSGFSHTGITVNGSGQLVIASGEHILCCSPFNTMDPINTSVTTPFEFRWYDVTNSQFLGVAGQRVTRRTADTIAVHRAPLCVAYVNSAITVEVRCVARSGNNVNAWDSYAGGLLYLGKAWGYIYSAIGA
jgi:hypothetical protein